jgi:alkaline phosphatase D
MPRPIRWLGSWALFALASCAHAELFTLAFGSCLHQQRAQPVWQGVLTTAPDVFVFGGDNVYADIGLNALRAEPARIGRAYAELATNRGWQALRARVPVYATWDDHDYGRGDAGAEYPYKHASKQFFMDFFAIPPEAPMRAREGIYDAHWLRHENRRIQLILLDTRSFRSPMIAGSTDAACRR